MGEEEEEEGVGGIVCNLGGWVWMIGLSDRHELASAWVNLKHLQLPHAREFNLFDEETTQIHLRVVSFLHDKYVTVHFI